MTFELQTTGDAYLLDVSAIERMDFHPGVPSLLAYGRDYWPSLTIYLRRGQMIQCADPGAEDLFEKLKLASIYAEASLVAHSFLHGRN
jgi:hypothetical protein